MKIMICTTRIRPDGIQTVFPPLGSMAIIQSLIKGGYQDTHLFDIDALRPPHEEVIEHFRRERPDVVGLSGVVSTSYKFIKELTADLHQILPETPVIVGGNVVASSEILLRLAKVDYCVVGEGEETTVDLVKYIEGKGGRSQSDHFEALRKIAGLTFIDEKDISVFTGYRPNLPTDGLYDLDYDILERDTDVNRYIIEPWYYPTFAYDARSYEPHRKGKKLATVVTTKGCVAKCTFCHRWDKGIRFVGVDRIVERIKMLQERYDVGFISFADENFGSNHKWNDELIEKLRPLDILYRIGGVRARTVNPDLLARLRDSGCVNVQYGIESGSQRMLDVMQKDTQVEHNINAVRWTYEAGLYTVYSMLFGMPGESPETIRETIEFLKQSTEYLPEPPYSRISANRLEALPGTPVYEYAQLRGWIGRTPEEEEKYLLHISNTGAEEIGEQINFTDYPDFIVQSWKRLMWMEAMHNWYKKHPERQMSLPKTLWKCIASLFVKNISRYGVKDQRVEGKKGRDLVDTFVDKDYRVRKDEIEESLIGLRYHTSLHFMRHFLVLEGVLNDFSNKDVPKRVWLKRLWELVVYYIRGPRADRFNAYRSMRITMKEIKPEPLSESDKNMVPLQLGR